MSDQPVSEQGLAGASSASPGDIAAYYDTWALANYDDDVAGWGYEAPGRVAAMAADHFARSAEAAGIVAVLDAGCGTGGVGTALHGAGFRNIVGGDFTPASIAAAQARAVYRSVVHLDLNERFNFDDAEFAATVCVGVFSYLQDTAAAIGEMLRVTQPGGIVIFTQRTDLWDVRDCPAIIERLVTAGACAATVSEPMAYLPLHPEFADDIEIIYTALTRTSNEPE